MYSPATLSELRDNHFDTIIDVRSPAEFAEDHIPGAINLPALSDEQRATIGTIYVQENAFKARKLGAAMVARNVANHLDTTLKEFDGSWQPLVYCWRGGQRSGSVASILSQIGWRTETLLGGYQAYRSLLTDRLHKSTWPGQIILIDGNTGTGKTDILIALENLGCQVIDLEGLANHRGSLFGGRVGGQPSQKAFESKLAAALDDVDPDQPLYLEAESSKIGRIVIPPGLWKAMKPSSRIVIQAPLDARAAYSVRVYDDILVDPDRIANIFDALSHFHARADIDAWRKLAREGKAETLAAQLMQSHYDPRYEKGRSNVFETVCLDTLDPAAIETAAAKIVKIHVTNVQAVSRK